MKIKFSDGRTKDVQNSYALRLIEQGKAVCAPAEKPREAVKTEVKP